MTRHDPPRELSPQEAHEENERAYDREGMYMAGLDLAVRHSPAPDFHQHLADGCRAFPEPPSGWVLTWAHGAEPRLERAA